MDGEYTHAKMNKGKLEIHYTNERPSSRTTLRSEDYSDWAKQEYPIAYSVLHSHLGTIVGGIRGDIEFDQEELGLLCFKCLNVVFRGITMDLEQKEKKLV